MICYRVIIKQIDLQPSKKLDVAAICSQGCAGQKSYTYTWTLPE